MAIVAGMINSYGSSSTSSSSWGNSKNFRQNKTMKGNERFRVSCVRSPVSSDPYKVLRIRRGASESDVKKAFRKLALRYHPDVCKGSDCGTRFHRINEAYNVVISKLREESSVLSAEKETSEAASYGAGYDPNNLWEEWMGWEGAGIRDYSSHINPYI